MSEAGTDIVKFRGELMAMTPEIANALPSHIKPERFQRVVMTVVQLQPELLRCDRRSLFASCIKCAADGLVPDGREAALVVFGGRVNYMPMFTGIQKRVRNSGEIASIQAHVIYENDEFTWEQGTASGITHKPKFPGDRGKPIGAYAVAKFKDDSDPQIEVMDINEIERVRAVSRTAKNGPWVQWWPEMARKSVFRRLAKWLPLDAEAERLFSRDDEAGSPTVAEPSGAVLEGTAETIDEFEAASRGITVTPPSEDMNAALAAASQANAADHDTEADQAAAYIGEIAECATTDAVNAFAKQMAVRSAMSGWKKSRPNLFKAVDDAVAFRLAQLEPVVARSAVAD